MANCGSLRDAINQANGLPGPHTINIATTGTLTLTSNLPLIVQPMTMTGPGQASFSIAPTCAGCRGFDIGAVAVSISGLTLTSAILDGMRTANAGANLTLTDVTITNTAPGGAGLRVEASTTALLTNVTISNGHGYPALLLSASYRN